MLPIYFFTVCFCLFAGLGFLSDGNNLIAEKLNLPDLSFLQNRIVSLLGAVIAIVLAAFKIFIPVKNIQSGRSLFFIGDFLPLLACFATFCVFASWYFSADEVIDIPGIFIFAENNKTIIGYFCLVAGILHLFFAPIVVF